MDTLEREPIVACTTLGLKQSAESKEQIIFSIPNQSAVRIIVPRFPGSCIQSNTKENLSLNSGASISEFVGIWNKANIPLGLFNVLIFSNSEEVISKDFIF